MEFVDIHTHILPGFDDGSQDLEQTLAMAQTAYLGGVKELVATPHVMKGVYENSKQDILKQVASVNYYLQVFGVQIFVLPGAEYYLEPDLPSRLAAGEILTINDNGHYILIELPATMVPGYTGKILYELQMQGVTPIIAHPERNTGLAKEPNLLSDWAKRGILSQVTSGSITGMFGREVKKRALDFLHNGSAQLVASDAHDAWGRAPVIGQAFSELERQFGYNAAFELTAINPNMIVKGEKLHPNCSLKVGTNWGQDIRKLITVGIDIFRF